MKKISFLYFLLLLIMSTGIEARRVTGPINLNIPKIHTPLRRHKGDIPHFSKVNSFGAIKDQLLAEARERFLEKGLSAEQANELYNEVYQEIQATMPSDETQVLALKQLQATFDACQFDVQKVIDDIKADKENVLPYIRAFVIFMETNENPSLGRAQLKSAIKAAQDKASRDKQKASTEEEKAKIEEFLQKDIAVLGQIYAHYNALEHLPGYAATLVGTKVFQFPTK